MSLGNLFISGVKRSKIKVTMSVSVFRHNATLPLLLRTLGFPFCNAPPIGVISGVRDGPPTFWSGDDGPHFIRTPRAWSPTFRPKLFYWLGSTFTAVGPSQSPAHSLELSPGFHPGPDHQCRLRRLLKTYLFARY